MTKKKYIELINKEVDGLISKIEKHQLHEYLEKDLQAKNLYQETTKTSEMLKQVTEVEPSPNLKKRILNSIELKSYAPEYTKKSVRSSISEWFTNLNPRSVYAFTAGVIIGLIIYSVFLTNMAQEQSMNNSNFYGTIGIPENANVGKLDQVPVEFPGLTGTINFYKFENILWFESNISNSDQFEMTFIFDQTKILFDSFKPLKQSNVLIQNKASTLNIVINGDCHFLVLFTQKSTENILINLKLGQAAEVLFNYKFQLRSQDRK
jgi:hypothetical protein